MIFAIIFALALLPVTVFGYEAINGETIVISKQQPIDGNLYVAGQNITIDQDIDGDVFCAGQSVTINGNVEGSVFCAGQTIAVNGNVRDSVRTAGNTIMINKEVGKNVMAFGAAINLGQDAKVGWDLFMGAGSAAVRGSVGRSVHGGGGNVFIDGMVGKDVKLELSKNSSGRKGSQSPELRIGENARIAGDVEYRSKNQAEIAEGARINGEVRKSEVAVRKEKQNEGFWGYIAGSIYSFLAALLVAFILIGLFGNMIRSITDKMFGKIGASIAWGLLVMIVAPIVIILLLVTLIGIPLALILSAAWLAALYISKILAGILIGRQMIKRGGETTEKSLYLSALVGIAVSWIIFSIPIIGWFLCLIAVWWGLGGMWLALKKN